MTTTFKSKIVKGNKNFTGFARIPNNTITDLRLGRLIKVTFKINTNKEVFYANIRDYSGLGFYIPKEIIKKHKIMGDIMEFNIEKKEGFKSKVGSDGRIYISIPTANENNLKNKEIVSIKGRMGGKVVEKFALVNIREKGKSTEYMANFDPKSSDKVGIFEIENLSDKNKRSEYPEIFNNLLKKFTFSYTQGNKIIVFYGNSVPIIVKSSINIGEFAHYLGCYFADGTKKGNSWAICSSTFEQARYYLSMHKQLIDNPNLNFNISYTCTNNKSERDIELNLKKTWKKHTGIEINERKLWVRYSKKESKKYNPHGTLIMREHKGLLVLFYNRLLKYCIDNILKNKNNITALKFICGVMEGDGSVNAKKRGHIQITTNQKQKGDLKRVLDITNLKYSMRKERDNVYRINIGAMEIIKNLLFFKDEIFKYYPKRRKTLIKRLFQMSFVRYLVGEQESTSGWIKSDLKEAGILDKKYKLTDKGKRIRECLIEMRGEL